MSDREKVDVSLLLLDREMPYWTFPVLDHFRTNSRPQILFDLARYAAFPSPSLAIISHLYRVLYRGAVAAENVEVQEWIPYASMHEYMEDFLGIKKNSHDKLLLNYAAIQYHLPQSLASGRENNNVV